ncbi:exopolysaccharide biosynthesis protein [Acuticoccus sp. M5D2P5]|uniref:exopolysaccharide biosynthesis protein n=1 Tax=Acuticoccus kalidii TaxID=2910977 RepID=UPI001F272093|nr:exopolysaccharide biosynthesis protein [Acuticoccus kalidii]MCF3935301.1 exopolysaccharide biosynthesis protein [Acuticoccus kalidii]
MVAGARSLSKVFYDLDSACERGDRVSVDRAVETLGHRGFGPFLFVPAVLEMSPIGVIPGLPTVLAVFIAVTAVQIVAGRSHLWLPGFFERRTISAERLSTAIAAMRPVATRFDRWFHERLPAFTGRQVVRIGAIACLAFCLTVPPLELVPFASTVPMAAIAAFGFAIMVGDGLLMAIGFALAAGAVVVGLGFIGGG